MFKFQYRIGDSNLISKSAARFLSVILIALLAPAALAEEKRYNVPIGDSPIEGPINAPVTIIEFLDFQ